MTLRMLDSITVANLPGGADAYLGYVDGRFATFPALRQRFPGAHLLDLAVFSSADATGCDCEPGDLSPAQVPGWVRRQLARSVWRPVVYASAAVMGQCLGELSLAGILRSSVRLLSAHYNGTAHICGPRTCAFPGVPACDGTQWTDRSPGLHGTRVDESVLAADFFGPLKPPAPALAQEPGMILVQPDRTALPAGTDWPGVFLLTSAGTLHHVTGSQGALNNVLAYQAAGIKGPVTITWAEYQAWAAG